MLTRMIPPLVPSAISTLNRFGILAMARLALPAMQKQEKRHTA